MAVAVDRQFRLFAVALVLISAPTLVLQVYAQPPGVSSPQPGWSDGYYAQLQAGVEKYNARLDDLEHVTIWGLDLGRVRNVVRNERVNVYVVDADGQTAAYSFRTDDEAKIRDLRHTTRADATVRVVAERSAVRRISSEYTQTRAVRDAYFGGEIEVTGVGVNDWVKWWLIENWIRHTVATR